jgi:hypothetical protein
MKRIKFVEVNGFSIQNVVKQGAALSPLLFKFAVEYAIRKA